MFVTLFYAAHISVVARQWYTYVEEGKNAFPRKTNEKSQLITERGDLVHNVFLN